MTPASARRAERRSRVVAALFRWAQPFPRTGCRLGGTPQRTGAERARQVPVRRLRTPPARCRMTRTCIRLIRSQTRGCGSGGEGSDRLRRARSWFRMSSVRVIASLISTWPSEASSFTASLARARSRVSDTTPSMTTSSSSLRTVIRKPPRAVLRVKTRIRRQPPWSQLLQDKGRRMTRPAPARGVTR